MLVVYICNLNIKNVTKLQKKYTHTKISKYDKYILYEYLWLSL
jgi:hypothetical protein